MTALTLTLQAPAAPISLPARPPIDIRAHEAVLDVVVPVYNEETDLPGCVRRLHAHLTRAFPYSFRITIADNASTDRTLAVAHELAHELPRVRVVHLAQKGRGRALAAVWSASDAPVLAYMDVDLSTDLGGLLPLVAPLISGHSDVAIGSRLARGARVVRGPKREFISPLLQPHPPDRARRAVQRRAVRVQGRPPRRRAAAPAAGRGHRLVLRHRAARCWPSGRACGSTRYPSTGWTTPTRRVDIVATAVADLKGVARVLGGLASGRIPVAQVRARFGRAPLTA